MNSTSHHTHIRSTLVVLVALVALALPASALAAGVVGTDAAGNVTYYGDDTANGVTVTTSLSSPAAGTLVFSETGITEGIDTANLCTPSANAVTCSFSTSDNLRLFGGDGPDRLTVDGPVRSSIEGETGADDLRGGDSYDGLLGGDGSDTLDGRGGADVLIGGAGPDNVMGAEGNDISLTDPGNNDQIDLGPGRDAFYTDNSDGTADVLQGGSGADFLGFRTWGTGDEAFSTVDLSRGTLTHGAFDTYDAGTDTLDGIEDAGEYAGGSGDDVLIGNADSNILVGGKGHDTIVGGRGTDTLIGDGYVLSSDYVVDLAFVGDDTFDALDGFEDRVQCGGGNDSVVSDSSTRAC